MNLSKETLTLIKNFASINGSLMLKQGNKLSTISEAKNVMAEATIAESFPQDFGIYDVNEFLGVVSLFQDPQLDFSDKHVMISDSGNSKIKYYAAGEGVVRAAPTQIKFPEPADVTFELNEAQIARIIRTAGVLKAQDVSVQGNGERLQVVVHDKKNNTSNAYEVNIGPTTQTFSANIKVENLKMLPGNYNVEVSSKKISRFINKDVDLKYFIAIEADSKF
jgi:hypothetical protein